MSPTRNRLLKVPEAAEHLNVGRTTVNSLIARGELRAVHIGRSVRISEAALAEFIERLERSAHEVVL